jgi:hypothetical protein
LPGASALGEGPALQVEKPRYDFGSVTEGDKVKHVFTVTNTGKAPLVIERVSTSCGCTAAVLQDKTVAPGGKTEIKVELDTTNRKGKQHKTATILSNDPKSPSTRLDIEGEVVPTLVFEPSYVQLEGKKGATTTTKVWLTGAMAASAVPKVDGVTGDDSVTATVIEEPAGKSVRRGVALTTKHPSLGRGRGEIQVSTGLEKKPQLKLRFSRTTTGNFSVPQTLYLTPSQPKQQQRSFEVKSSEPNFQLQSTLVEGPFSASIEKTEGAYRVTVTPKPPPGQTGALTGKLVLLSNDPLEPRKEISLTLGRPRAARPPVARPSASR